MYKQTMGKRIALVALTLLLVMIFVLPANQAQAAAATYDVGLYKGEQAQEDWTYPTAEGMVFAGWYTDEAYTTPYTQTTGQAYAKFVPAELMTVKKQLSTGASLTSDTINIRFVTAIDSLKFSSVSFEVSTSAGKSWVMNEKKAYTSIQADGEVLPITPASAFGEAAEYFVLHSLTGIPKAAYNDTFQVNVIWNTLDGTKVTSAQTNTFTTKELIAENCAHTNTEIQDAEKATCGEAGYTGDTYCTDCDMKLAAGETITATGEHTYVYGICSVCAAANPDCKAPVTPTEDTDNRWISKDLATDTAIGTWTKSDADAVTLTGSTLTIDDADANASPYAWYHLNTALTGEVVVEFKVSSTALSKSAGLYFTVWDTAASASTPAIDVRMFSDKIQCYYTNAESNKPTAVNFAGTYTVGTEYTMKLTANVAKDTCSIFINDQLIAQDFPMRVDVNSLNRVRFSTVDKTLVATVTYENLKIYYLNEVCTHTNTEVRDAKAATCGAAGYTGDTYCADCDVLVSEGETIDATGAHNYAGGTCGVCGATDPDYVAPPVAPTESTDSRWIYQNVLMEADTWKKDGITAEGNSVTLTDGKLQIVNNNTSTLVSVNRGLGDNDAGNEIVVEFNVSSTEMSNNYGLYFVLRQGNTIAVDMRMFKNRIECYYTNDEGKPVCTDTTAYGEYNADTIYKVQIVANIDTDTYNVFIGGTLILKDVKMRNAVTAVNDVRLWMTKAGMAATVTYENLKIYYLNEPTAE